MQLAVNSKFCTEGIAQAHIQKVIELFRELKRQNQTVLFEGNNVSALPKVDSLLVQKEVILDQSALDDISNQIKQSFGESSVAHTQFSNFCHNLGYFDKINKADWNSQAVVNQKCGSNGVFPNLNIGLNNIGATCFMNSTTQCLVIVLMHYFANPRTKQ